MPSSTLEFFLPMIPPTVTGQMRRVSAAGPGRKPLFYDSPQLAQARSQFLAHLFARKPSHPLAGPVRLRVLWCFPRTGKHAHGEFKTSRPDTDNLEKVFKDCLTKAGFWKDDAQVVQEWIEKRYADIPGIYVSVTALQSSPAPAGSPSERPTPSGSPSERPTPSDSPSERPTPAGSPSERPNPNPGPPARQHPNPPYPQSSPNDREVLP